MTMTAEHIRPRGTHVGNRLRCSRAAVLGANDGVLSTSSLIIGVASTHAPHASVLLASVSGLVAGAMSMSAGEDVSVRSQADSKRAARACERAELADDPRAVEVARRRIVQDRLPLRIESWHRLGR